VMVRLMSRQLDLDQARRRPATTRLPARSGDGRGPFDPTSFWRSRPASPNSSQDLPISGGFTRGFRGLVRPVCGGFGCGFQRRFRPALIAVFGASFGRVRAAVVGHIQPANLGNYLQAGRGPRSAAGRDLTGHDTVGDDSQRCGARVAIFWMSSPARLQRSL
jgi:hypothetical protein